MAEQLGIFTGDEEISRAAIVAELSKHLAGSNGLPVRRTVTIRWLHLGRDSTLDCEVTMQDAGASPWTVRASLSSEVGKPLCRRLGLPDWGLPRNDDPTGPAEQVALAFVDVIVDELALMQPVPPEIEVLVKDINLIARIEQRARERLTAAGF